MLRKIAAAAGFLLALIAAAHAQFGPQPGPQPAPSPWIYTGVGDAITYQGKVVANPSASNQAGFSLTPGAAPAFPVNGDLWTTPSGLFVQINNATIGPLGTAACPTCAVTNATNVFLAPQKINLNTGTAASPLTGSILQLVNANGTTARAELDSYAAAARWSCVRADGTLAAPTALLSGDEICSLNTFGYNGGAIVGPGAAIRTWAAENWTPTATGTYLDFATTPAGTTALTSQMELANDGGLLLAPSVTGGSKGAGTINVGSGYYINGNGLLPIYSLGATLQLSSNVLETLGLSGDVSSSANSFVTTVTHVNGVAYAATPSTNTVPVVTAANTVTYEQVPNAAIANPSITIGATAVALGTSVPNNSVTLPLFAQIPSKAVLGNSGAATGNVATPWTVSNTTDTTIPLVHGVISLNHLACFNDTVGTVIDCGFGAPIPATYGGTGVNNGSSTLTLGASLTTTGAGAPILAFQASPYTYTFPAGTDTLVTLGATQTLTNKTLSGGTLSGTIAGTPTLSGANFISLSNIAQDATAYSILGNTTGAAANYAPFTIGGLTNKAAPTSSDLVLIQDQAAGGALKQSTVGQIVGSVGVSSLNGLTGPLNLQGSATNGITVSPSGSNITLGTAFTRAGTGAVTTTVSARLQEGAIFLQDYGADCTGAADSTTAFTDAVAEALSARQPIQICQGTVKVNIASGASITAGISIGGAGRGLSIINNTNTGGTLLSLATTSPIYLHDFGYQVTGTPTAGAFVSDAALASGENAASVYERISCTNVWDCLYLGRSSQWLVHGSFFSNAYDKHIYVANANNVDSGDSEISASNFVEFQGGVCATTGIDIYQQSSGGLRIVGNKFNCGQYQYYLYATGSSSDTLINGNSFENCAGTCIVFQNSSSSYAWGNVEITGNEIAPFVSGVSAIQVNGTSGWMNAMTISGNVGSVSGVASWATISGYTSALSFTGNSISGPSGSNILNPGSNITNCHYSGNSSATLSQLAGGTSCTNN